MTVDTDSQITTLDDIAPEAPKKRGRPAAHAVIDADGAETLTGANTDPNLSGKMALLTVHPTGDDGGKEALFVGLNGYAYLVPRGKPWKVPIEVANAANPMSVSYVYTNGEYERVETPRNPVTITPL